MALLDSCGLFEAVVVDAAAVVCFYGEVPHEKLEAGAELGQLWLLISKKNPHEQFNTTMRLRISTSYIYHHR